jgi:hypothetical protein
MNDVVTLYFWYRKNWRGLKPATAWKWAMSEAKHPLPKIV